MEPPLALTTSNWILLASVIINGLAFIGVVVSLLLLRAQGLAQRNATLVIAYQNVTAQMADVNRFFLEHVELRRYFYDGADLPSAEVERARVLATAEMYLNVMDNVLTQLPMLSRGEVAADWEAYFRDVYRSSPALREFWGGHGRAWFSNSPLTALYADAPQ